MIGQVVLRATPHQRQPLRPGIDVFGKESGLQGDQALPDMLTQIKRAILHGQYDFSQKAQLEMERDGLTEYDVLESILTAPTIYKTLHARRRFRQGRREQLYIIQSTNYDGLFISTKDKWVQAAELRRYYFLVSAKRAI